MGLGYFLISNLDIIVRILILIFPLMGVIFYYINWKKDKKIKDLEEAGKAWDNANNKIIELKTQNFNDFKKMVNGFYHGISSMESNGFVETVMKLNEQTDISFKSDLELLKRGFMSNIESQLISFLNEIEHIPYPDNDRQFSTFRSRFSSLINQYEIYIKNIENTLGTANLEKPSIQYLMYHLKSIGKMKKVELRRFY